MMESNVFKTLAELNKEYNIVRDDILKRHGYEKGYNVRLKNAIAMYQKFDNKWIITTSTKSAMIDRVKFNKTCGKDAEYKIVAMV